MYGLFTSRSLYILNKALKDVLLQFPNFDCFIQSGNMNGDRPYIHVIGSTCSQCPSGYSCNNGLCSK